MGKEEEIRLIAYGIWEEEGCIDGRDCEHWLRAEAIWELNQKKPVVKSAETKPKQAAKRSTKITGKVPGKKRKPKKT